jgi:hypothetical protein
MQLISSESNAFHLVNPLRLPMTVLHTSQVTVGKSAKWGEYEKKEHSSSQSPKPTSQSPDLVVKTAVANTFCIPW